MNKTYIRIKCTLPWLKWYITIIYIVTRNETVTHLPGIRNTTVT